MSAIVEVLKGQRQRTADKTKPPNLFAMKDKLQDIHADWYQKISFRYVFFPAIYIVMIYSSKLRGECYCKPYARFYF